MLLSALESFVATLQTERGSVMSLSVLEPFVANLQTERGSVMSLSALEPFVAALQTDRGSVMSLSALESFTATLQTDRGSVMSLSALEPFVAALQTERGSVMSLSALEPFVAALQTTREAQLCHLVHWNHLWLLCRLIEAQLYCDVLRRLRENVRLKRPQKWQNRNLIIHQDNALAHMFFKVSQFLAKNNMTVIPHPPYSPDLPPVTFSSSSS